MAFDDLAQGRYAENLARDCGDIILRRSDGVFAYQLAVVCDDGAGGIWAIAPDFYLDTVAAYPGLIGEYGAYGGWTWAEMLDFLDTLPEGIYAGERMYNRTVLDTWFGGYEAFLDEEAGTCSFDSPLFIRALKFAGNLGDWKTARVRDPIESMDPEERNRLYYTGKVALKLVRFASACSGIAVSRFPLPKNPPTLEEVKKLMG